jgi:hypothetical protein
MASTHSESDKNRTESTHSESDKNRTESTHSDLDNNRMPSPSNTAHANHNKDTTCNESSSASNTIQTDNTAQTENDKDTSAASESSSAPNQPQADVTLESLQKDMAQAFGNFMSQFDKEKSHAKGHLDGTSAGTMYTFTYADMHRADADSHGNWLCGESEFTKTLTCTQAPCKQS